MDRNELRDMCEETWGHSLEAIVEEMRDFDVLNQPMFVEESQLSHEERVVQFFVDMVNRISVSYTHLTLPTNHPV